MSKEYVDVELNVGKELADKLNKQTKKELLNGLVMLILKTRIQQETIASLENEQNTEIAKLTVQRQTLLNEAEKMQTRLDEAESYVEQGRIMIQSIMERWFHYSE